MVNCSTVIFLYQDHPEYQQFLDPIITPDIDAGCVSLTDVTQFLVTLFFITSVVLALIILIISFFGYVKGDYKYFISSQVIFFTMKNGYYQILKYFNLTFSSFGFLSVFFNSYLQTLAFIACFPLALHRFMVLFFPNHKFINKTRYILLFLTLIYLFFCVFHYFTSDKPVYLPLIFFFVTLTLVLTILCFWKIREESRQIVDKVHFSKQLAAIRIASLYSLCYGLISLGSPLATYFFMNYYHNGDVNLYMSNISLFIFLWNTIEIVFYATMFFDYLLILVIIKDYRLGFLKIVKFFLCCFWPKKRQSSKSVTITVTNAGSYNKGGR